MSKISLVRSLRLLSLWLFWPGVLLIGWGELTPHPPNLGGPFGWDKLEHFTANSIGALGGLGVAGFLAV